MNANVSEILWGQENNYYINLKMTLKDKTWKLYKLCKMPWDLNHLQKTPSNQKKKLDTIQADKKYAFFKHKFTKLVKHN